MITLRADTLSKNLAKIGHAKKRLEQSLNKQYRQKALAIFKDLLTVWPQYSGDSVSNWYIVVGQETEKPYKVWGRKGLGLEISRRFGSTLPGEYNRERNVVSAGDPAAVNFAFTRAKFVQYNYTQKLYFTNATPLEFTATTVTSTVDGEKHNLRPENILEGGVEVFSYLRSKYKK